MIAINCVVDLENTEGKIKIKDSFKKMLPLDKADLLKDWTAQMDELYEEILKEWEVEFVRKNKRDGIVPNTDITVAELKGFVADAETMIKDGMHNTVKKIKVDDQENIKRIREAKNET
tara:strand:- start:77 stop:430 length:354 start_codon:yes stop_codon:yes gene_type:complete